MSEIDFSQMREPKFSKKAYESAQGMIDRVNRKSGFLNFKQCNACYCSDYVFESKKLGIDILRCNNCGVSFSSLYPRNFDDLYSDDAYLNKSLVAYDLSRKYRIERFAKERIAILNQYHHEGTLLDVGCGTGWFLEEATKKYQVAGVEYSDSLRSWLQDNLGISSWKTIEDVPGNFDIITAFDLIEHVVDPYLMLQKMKNKLKKDGKILIYTPNKNSLSFKILGEKNNLVCPPQHLFYFDEISFIKMANKVGLICISYETKGTDVEDIRSYYECWKDSSIHGFNPSEAQRFLDEIGFSNHARFILKHR